MTDFGDKTNCKILNHGFVCDWYTYRNFNLGIPMTSSMSNTILTRVKMVTTHMISIFISTLITRCYWLQNQNHHLH